MVENKRSFEYIVQLFILYGILFFGVVFVLIPLAWTLSTSLQTIAEIYAIPKRWFPSVPQFSNYREVLTTIPFGLYYANTLKITLFNIVGTLISCSLVAFGFARMKFPGKNFLFLLVISTTMIPLQVLIIPRFVMFRYFGWLNTHLPLIIPSFFGEAMGIFLFRQYFMTIPKELDQAALIDGYGFFGIYLKIIMPLSKPVFGIVGVFTFIQVWKDFFSPLIFLSKTKLYTISLGLLGFYNGFDVEWHLMMAASVIALLPPLAIFFVGQKYFLEGAVVNSGLKQ